MIFDDQLSSAIYSSYFFISSFKWVNNKLHATLMFESYLFLSLLLNLYYLFCGRYNHLRNEGLLCLMSVSPALSISRNWVLCNSGSLPPNCSGPCFSTGYPGIPFAKDAHQNPNQWIPLNWWGLIDFGSPLDSWKCVFLPGQAVWLALKQPAWNHQNCYFFCI